MWKWKYLLCTVRGFYKMKVFHDWSAGWIRVVYLVLSRREFVPKYAECSSRHSRLFRNLPIQGIQDTPICCYAMQKLFLTVLTRDRKAPAMSSRSESMLSGNSKKYFHVYSTLSSCLQYSLQSISIKGAQCWCTSSVVNVRAISKCQVYYKSNYT